uniref:Transcriptional regulator, MarR family n=1 Tax=Mycobacterium sp. (strain MCS) TaxID=164756 RepID=A0A5Q5BSU6_MYCSS
MSRNPEADEVWRAMTALVTDNRDSWRRATVDQTGLPFSRIRILLRLSRGSMTVKEVAHAVTIDPPAATVSVNDLEDRGLVMRQTIPTNRRYKVVSLTDAGWSMVATINAVDDPAPEALAALEGNELRALRDAIARVSAARQTLNESRGRIAQRTTLSPA